MFDINIDRNCVDLGGLTGFEVTVVVMWITTGVAGRSMLALQVTVVVVCSQSLLLARFKQQVLLAVVNKLGNALCRRESMKKIF